MCYLHLYSRLKGHSPYSCSATFPCRNSLAAVSKSAVWRFELCWGPLYKTERDHGDMTGGVRIVLVVLFSLTPSWWNIWGNPCWSSQPFSRSVQRVILGRFFLIHYSNSFPVLLIGVSVALGIEIWLWPKAVSRLRYLEWRKLRKGEGAKYQIYVGFSPTVYGARLLLSTIALIPWSLW